MTTDINKLIDKKSVTIEEYFDAYETKITQDSERLFVTDFLFPILGNENIKHVVPQYPFIDSEGRNRRIDFAIVKGNKKIALEVNGETYHAEGIIPNEMFDDNLNRQNEILNAGWQLQRFSFSQLQSPIWRIRVSSSIQTLLRKSLPELLSEKLIEPTFLQKEVLEALDFYRSKGWTKGLVILPTGTGKTFLSALDAHKVKGKILFVVHRLDILSQNKEAYQKIFPEETLGVLTGELKENQFDAKILFASKDTLIKPETLFQYSQDYFDYVVIDEVHHGQAPTYKAIFDYFAPPFFMLGLTATPDRTDRKDILELFDYNKVFEYSLSEAIENGFLVPYTYYGLKDNVNYSNIRHNGNKYNIQDLDKNLIIPQRNKQILDEYIEKGEQNKAIGFCASIKHAERMAQFFNKNGISSVAITSNSENRNEDIEKFRDNEYNVVFTVDLFNEGVDFPNVRTLLFLRPTESKTVFMQQLGRGLRNAIGKDSVVVLDFISNYKKANNIRKYLSQKQSEKKNPKTGRIEKIEYEYNPKCKVIFDAEVEQILDKQDTTEREITKADLKDAYFTLAEQLQKKPTQQEINEKGEFKLSKYLNKFGSWVKFLREVGEFTEASYQFPQGLHLGHILYIIKTIKSGKFKNTNLDDNYIRIRGNLSSGQLGTFQRQTKYKLQGIMEIGLILDDRTLGNDTPFSLKLTPKGETFYSVLKPVIDKVDLSFKQKSKTVPSWEMTKNHQLINQEIENYLSKNPTFAKQIIKIFIDTNAVNLMLNYLYQIERKETITKAEIYGGFFSAPFVKDFCDRNGIEAATEEGAKHRCPFLLNILEAIGVIEQTRSEITMNYFVVSEHTIKLNEHEEPAKTLDTIKKIKQNKLSSSATTLLREKFGKEFLTKNYYLKHFKYID